MSKPKFRRVIAAANMPMRMPWSQTLVLYLFLDRLNAPGWLWGVLSVFVFLAWALWFWALATDISVDVISPHPSAAAPRGVDDAEVINHQAPRQHWRRHSNPY